MLRSDGEDFFLNRSKWNVDKNRKKTKNSGKKDTRADAVPPRVSPDAFVSFIQCDISIRFPPDCWGGLWYQKTPPPFADSSFPLLRGFASRRVREKRRGAKFAVTFILSEGLWNQGSIARHRCLDTGCSCAFYRNDGIGGVEEHGSFLSDSSFIINTTPTGELVGRDLWCRCLLSPGSLSRAGCRCDLSIISGAVVWGARSLAGDTGSLRRMWAGSDLRIKHQAVKTLRCWCT